MCVISSIAYIGSWRSVYIDVIYTDLHDRLDLIFNHYRAPLDVIDYQLGLGLALLTTIATIDLDA